MKHADQLSHHTSPPCAEDLQEKVEVESVGFDNTAFTITIKVNDGIPGIPTNQ